RHARRHHGDEQNKDNENARPGRDRDQAEVVGETQANQHGGGGDDDQAAPANALATGTRSDRLRDCGDAHRTTPPACATPGFKTPASSRISSGIGSTPSTWLSSVCGSSPLRRNASATCRKRKHMR